jgi:hypothetical protein
VAALPQRQLRPGLRQRPAELGVELVAPGRRGPCLSLLEQAPRGGEVAAGDVEPGPLQAQVHRDRTGVPVPLQGRAEVPVGLVPAPGQELEPGGDLQEGVLPCRAELAAGLGTLQRRGQRLLQPAGGLAELGHVERGPAEPVHIAHHPGDVAGVAQVDQPPGGIAQQPERGTEHGERPPAPPPLPAGSPSACPAGPGPARTRPGPWPARPTAARQGPARPPPRRPPGSRRPAPATGSGPAARAARPPGPGRVAGPPPPARPGPASPPAAGRGSGLPPRRRVPAP